VSDIEDQWEHNYRSPDVVVYLNGTTARDFGTHWVGGPDFCVEIVSRNDRSRDKLDFYAKVGTRELLVVDRFPWGLELYRLQDGVLTLVGESTLGQPNILIGEVLPLTFRLVEGDPRPKIEVVHADGVQRWSA
jgi:Uma2 family endonuclease